MQDRTAVVLVNLGTPDRPDAESIRRYLDEFLSDPRVVDFPRWLWLPILRLIILRSRPPKLVEKYTMIWGTHDGPIRNITNALAKRVGALLGGIRVEVAMTYGSPAMREVLDALEGYDRLLVLPLFPQYAGATTGAVKDVLDRALKGHEGRWQVDLVHDYATDSHYIQALSNSVRSSMSFRSGTPMIVFSFHGIPLSQHRRGDPYADQCRSTAALVAAQLDLPQDRWMVTFQSRFGPLPWLQPYTDKTMAALPARGVKDVLVVCPGFAADCLETIEEIRVLNREIFLAAGGESFSYVRALNASQAHAQVISNLVKHQLAQN